MATKRNLTNADATPERNLTNADARPDWSLSEQQVTAIDLLVTGKTLQATADQVGVQRPTVSHWVNHHPGFQAALNRRRQELWTAMSDGLRALAPKALEVLARALEGEESVAAAIHVLKSCGLYGGVRVPGGSTEPEEIAAKMQLAEDDRQHAAENAEIAIKRRSYDRFMSALAAAPPRGSPSREKGNSLVARMRQHTAAVTAACAGGALW